MKYLKTYETMWLKNIKVGDIYVIDEMLISTKEYKANINLGRIVKIVADEFFDIETFIKGSYEKYTLEFIHQRFIKRRATKEEINEYNTIEARKKFGL